MDWILSLVHIPSSLPWILLFCFHPPMRLYLEIAPLWKWLRLNEVKRMRSNLIGLVSLEGPDISASLHVQRRQAMWGHGGKVAVYYLGTNPIDTLILDFQPPALWEINVCCLSPSGCGILPRHPEQTKTLWNVLTRILKERQMGSPNVGCLMPSSNAISPCGKNLTLPSPMVVVGLSGGVIYHWDYCPLLPSI